MLNRARSKQICSLILGTLFLSCLSVPSAIARETVEGNAAAEVIKNGEVITSVFVEREFDWEMLIKYDDRLYHCRVTPKFNQKQILAFCVT